MNPFGRAILNVQKHNILRRQERQEVSNKTQRVVF